jgi:hypothetical protein
MDGRRQEERIFFEGVYLPIYLYRLYEYGHAYR